MNLNFIPDSKVHGAIMGPIWGRQDPVDHMLAPWTLLFGKASKLRVQAILLLTWFYWGINRICINMLYYVWDVMIHTSFNDTLNNSWWRHHMETFSALLAICTGNSPVPGEFPAQRPATRSFAIFFDLRLNNRLSKQLWGWWFETLSRPSWCYCKLKHEGRVIFHCFIRIHV